MNAPEKRPPNEARAEPVAGTPAKPRSRRRLAILLLLLALSGVWLGYRAYRAHQVHAAVTSLEKLGGWAVYDYDGVRRTQPDGPVLVRKMLGDKYFVKVDAVHIGGLTIQEPQIAQLVALLDELPDVDAVYLETLKLGDTSVPHLAKLGRLKRLYITDVLLTPEGSAKLKKALPQTQVTVGP